ncbi:MAG: hypothetical protein ABIQ02_03395 [Saprospiraceae bacterium]
MAIQSAMKFVILFGLCSNLCFSQASIFDSIYLNPNFRPANLTEDQKDSVRNEFNILNLTPNLNTSNKSELPAFQKGNLYTYSLLNDMQKHLFESSWKHSALSQIHSRYHYLNLSEKQKNEIIEFIEDSPKFDTLKVIEFYPNIPRSFVISLLDSTQLKLETEQQSQALISYEKYLAWSDIEKSKDTTFEKYRLDLVAVYSKKYLQKAKQRILNKILKISPDDAKEIGEITGIYRARVNLDLLRRVRDCYSRDSVLIAPNTKLLVAYKLKRYTLMPNLCTYWCRFGVEDTAETKNEEEHILKTLENFKIKYKHILDREINNIKKNKLKLNTKIEAARPAKKPGTVVSIVAEARIQAVDDYAELLLVPITGE